jgi:hypothetical protein
MSILQITSKSITYPFNLMLDRNFDAGLSFIDFKWKKDSGRSRAGWFEADRGW